LGFPTNTYLVLREQIFEDEAGHLANSFWVGLVGDLLDEGLREFDLYKVVIG